jgi:hypothetical protein
MKYAIEELISTRQPIKRMDTTFRASRVKEPHNQDIHML